MNALTSEIVRKTDYAADRHLRLLSIT